MAKIDLDAIAQASQSGAKTFDQFTANFQENIANLSSRSKFGLIESDNEYVLDEDGYIIGDIWSEGIAAEVMSLNGFQATTIRIETLIEAREIFGKGSVPTDHALVAKGMGHTTAEFLKMFPKYPIIYFTRWGNLRKPYDLKDLLDHPVKR
tara:strand:- start:699 stop:1151 length:453 start_codon:yes stop_codon:yes gene_type:complete